MNESLALWISERLSNADFKAGASAVKIEPLIMNAKNNTGSRPVPQRWLERHYDPSSISAFGEPGHRA